MINVDQRDEATIRQMMDVAERGESASGWERIIMLSGEELRNGDRDAVVVTMTVKDGRVMFSYEHGMITEGDYVFKSRIPHGAMNTVMGLLQEAHVMVASILRDRPPAPRNGGRAASGGPRERDSFQGSGLRARIADSTNDRNGGDRRRQRKNRRHGDD